MFFCAHACTHTQVDTGILSACFRDKDGLSYCIVQLLQPMDVLGTQVSNEFDCPLLSLTDVFRCVPSKCICHSVSVLHECSSSCCIKTTNRSTVIERELVQMSQLVFEHDFKTSTIYCFNVYCMNNASCQTFH